MLVSTVPGPGPALRSYSIRTDPVPSSKVATYIRSASMSMHIELNSPG